MNNTKKTSESVFSFFFPIVRSRHQANMKNYLGIAMIPIRIILSWWVIPLTPLRGDFLLYFSSSSYAPVHIRISFPKHDGNIKENDK